MAIVFLDVLSLPGATSDPAGASSGYLYYNINDKVIRFFDGSAWATVGVELPDQAGNTGKFLTTNGAAPSWAAVDALPSQAGNAGEYLTTDGTTASWAAITTDPTPSVFLLGGM